MCRLYIVGNPNSGKTTLFNNLTKSAEHVGNWHGVTVDKKSKIVKLDGAQYEIVDLPGLYSMNAFSLEEQVSINAINDMRVDDKILYLVDANNFKRSMLLAINLLMLNKNIKILINNYQTFQKNGGEIDAQYLQKILGCEVCIFDAQKSKMDINFFNFSTRETAFILTLKNKCFNTDNGNIVSIVNGNEIVDSSEVNKTELSKLKNIEIVYEYILKISKNCIKNNKIKNKIYGYSNIDNKILKLKVFIPLFIFTLFFIIYFTFFLIGPIISDIFINILYLVIQKPVMMIIRMATSSTFIISLFSEGVFGACFSVLGFLPQICLMYLFLSLLENSGLISRMAFLFDDMLQKVGLNGKMVYTLLMGIGCSTTATLSAKNMTDKNAQIKASILTPFISCSAKLPIYVTVAFALFNRMGVWLIGGLYLLSILMTMVFAIIFERTILPSQKSPLLLEFPPLQSPKIFNILQSVKNSCKQFLIKVFGIIFVSSILLWLLSNVNIKFQYVGDVGYSILYSLSTIVSWVFKPIGLDNPNIICALLVGLVAKELILSNFAISNKITNLSLLGASLVSTSSAVNFNVASGISFLVFVLLYFPCISNFGVLLKEVGTKYTIIGVLVQLGLAYACSYVIYNLLTKGLAFTLLALLVAVIILFAIKTIYKKIKLKKIICDCKNCNKCNK